jgi:Uma2 family endonuclease
MNSAQRRLLMTMDEFLAFENASETKHEFLGGHVYAMTGGSIAHAQVISNLLAVLHPAARSAGCRAFVSDAKLRIGDIASFYPDVMVCCDPTDDDPRHRERPCLIVEVLSPSSIERDRETKLAAYTNLPWLKAYLIIDPLQPEVEVHARVPGSEPGSLEWASPVICGAGESLVLPCPEGVVLDVDSLYS